MRSATSQAELDALLDSNYNSLVVINFYAEGNELCQLSTATTQFEHVTFVRVNITELQDLANRYGVVAAPAFIFFKNKTVLDSVNGADQEALQTLLGKHASLERDCADSLESTVVSNPKHDTPDPKRQENCFPLSNGHLQSIWQPEAFQNLDPTCLPPTHHFNDVLSQLSVTLNQSTQLRAARSPIETPISEPTLTLYCPVESGEYIIDATVKELARRTGSQVQVIDITQLAVDGCGSYWLDSLAGLESFGVSVPHSTPARERLEQLIEAILGSSPPELDAVCASGRSPRLIYVRDFRFLANCAPPFYAALLAVVHKQLRQRLESHLSTPMAIILGISACLDWSTPQVKSELIHENWGYQVNSETPKDYDESPDAQSGRESRAEARHSNWDDGQLFKIVFRVLAKTNVFPGVTRAEYKTAFKYSRVSIIAPERRNLERERKGREKRRLEVNTFYAQMALYAVGAELLTGPPTSQEDLDEFTQLCRHRYITFDLLRCLADQAVGAVTIASHSSRLGSLYETLSSRSRVGVTWDDLKLAWKAQATLEEERSNWLEGSTKPSKDVVPTSDSSM